MGSLWMHKDGGLYVTDFLAHDTDQSIQVVVYHHAWPFDVKHYTRPADQWTPERFSKMQPQHWEEFVALDREHFQALVTKNRTERKQAEKKAQDARVKASMFEIEIPVAEEIVDAIQPIPAISDNKLVTVPSPYGRGVGSGGTDGGDEPGPGYVDQDR